MFCSFSKFWCISLIKVVRFDFWQSCISLNNQHKTKLYLSNFFSLEEIFLKICYKMPLRTWNFKVDPSTCSLCPPPSPKIFSQKKSPSTFSMSFLLLLFWERKDFHMYTHPPLSPKKKKFGSKQKNGLFFSLFEARSPKFNFSVHFIKQNQSSVCLLVFLCTHHELK